MSLKDAALQAHTDQREMRRKDAAERREAELDNLIDRWDTHWQYKEIVPACPSRGDFRRVGMVPATGRSGTVSGFAFEVDDIPFLYSTNYNDHGLLLMLRCPDCGLEYATSFYGLAQLGQLIKTQKAIGHHCYENEVKQVAYAIRSAERATNRSAQEYAHAGLQAALLLP